jgi:aminoglycoside phosphotransferase (APT) family kinase protein
VRIPSSKWYAAQVEKEQQWLPKLAPHLPLPIPVPLAMGEPGEGYPWNWSIYKWLEGETAATAQIANLRDFASDLARFLSALQSIDARDGPIAGQHSFYRGGPLKTYDTETRKAIAALKDKIDVDAATRVWEAALATSWQGPPVWVHGDISSGNLLLQDGRLSAVIDFGQLAVGDPACDLALAWTLFEGKSREVFRTMLPLDDGTWARGKAWTLWKALILAAGITDSNTAEAPQALRIIDEVLADYGQ